MKESCDNCVKKGTVECLKMGLSCCSDWKPIPEESCDNCEENSGTRCARSSDRGGIKCRNYEPIVAIPMEIFREVPADSDLEEGYALAIEDIRDWYEAEKEGFWLRTVSAKRGIDQLLGDLEGKKKSRFHPEPEPEPEPEPCDSCWIRSIRESNGCKNTCSSWIEYWGKPKPDLSKCTATELMIELQGRIDPA